MILLVQSFRHLRQAHCRGKAVGFALSRAALAAFMLAVLSVEGLQLYRQETPEQAQPVNTRRDKLERVLRQNGDRHVIIVRYTGRQNPHEEWVYNHADIDSSDVVWARDMGPKENTKLAKYFPSRQIWLLEPDRDPERLMPYR